MNQDKVYSVTLGTPGKLNIINAATGSVVGNIIYQGDLVQGPIVIGNQCTLVATRNNISRGSIFKLPSGSLQQSYSV